MSIRALVVDDEPLARARLRRLLLAQGVDVVAEGDNGSVALELVNTFSVDILFIDINMPIKTGLQAAKEISALDTEPPAIVFCTAYDEHAVAAFKTNAVAYLLKPIQADDIKGAIAKAASLNRFQMSRLLDEQNTIKSLAVNYQGALQNIALREFAYFRSVEKNVFATLRNGDEILVDKTLKQLESDLGDDFLRVHRAALMNKQQALKLMKDDDGKVCVVLKTKDINLPVSRRHLSKVKKCFQ